MKLIDSLYVKQFVTCSAAGDTVYHAVSALELISCPSGRLREINYQGIPITYFSKHIDLINTLHQPGLDISYSIRYVSKPHKYSLAGGRINICVFCKVKAESPEFALEAVTEQTEQLLIQLCGNLSEYQWEIVKDSAVFYDYWEPMDWSRANIIDIRRREDLISLDLVRVNHNLGFLKDINEEDEFKNYSPIYFIHPFIQHAGQLEKFLRMMLLTNDPLALTITLKPVTLSEVEESFLLDEVSRSEGYHAISSGNIQRIQQQLSQMISQGLMDQILTLQDAPFLVTISLASPTKIPHSLAEATGIAISASVGEVPNELYFVQSLIQKGGYDVIKPVHADDIMAARNNAQFLEQDQWGQQLAPEKMNRIRYMMAGLEASCAFRFPEENGYGLPGINVHNLRNRSLPRELIPDHPNKQDGLLLGKNTYLGLPQDIYLPTKDRLTHMYVVGQTGTGKSTLLKTMLLSDMLAGRGCALIDPHGDLFEELLGMIPAHRMNDVVVFDPSDLQFPIGLNLLEARDPHEKHFIVREMQGIMSRLLADQYGTTFSQQIAGPIFYRHMHLNMLLAMSDPDQPGTLLDFYEIFQSSDYWKRWVPLKDTDPQLASWVKDYLPNNNYTTKSNGGESTMGEHISSKFTDFLFDPRLRAIFGQTKSTIDFDSILKDGKILLINLAKGLLGEANSRFLGFIIMAKLQAEAMKRSKISPSQRRPYFLYVDEFQALATDNFTVMLSEARKFGLGLVLANQFISQISDARIIQAVFGNVGSLMSFRLGRMDSEIIEPQFLPHFDRVDLTNQPNWQVAARVNVNGKSLIPFTLNTIQPDITPDDNIAKEVRARSRSKYGTPIEVVNEMISKTYKARR